MIIRTILRRSDPEPLEIAAGLMAIAWGVVLAVWGSWSAGLEHVHPSHRLSSVVWGAEWRQGTAAALAGLAQLLTVEFQMGPMLRGAVATVGVLLWSIVAASFVHGSATNGEPGTGVPVYVMFVIVTSWIVYRHGVEARVRRSL